MQQTNPNYQFLENLGKWHYSSKSKTVKLNYISMNSLRLSLPGLGDGVRSDSRRELAGRRVPLRRGVEAAGVGRACLRLIQWMNWFWNQSSENWYMTSTLAKSARMK